MSNFNLQLNWWSSTLNNVFRVKKVKLVISWISVFFGLASLLYCSHSMLPFNSPTYSFQQHTQDGNKTILLFTNFWEHLHKNYVATSQREILVLLNSSRLQCPLFQPTYINGVYLCCLLELNIEKKTALNHALSCFICM